MVCAPWGSGDRFRETPQCVSPCIAFVPHEPLQDTDSAWFGACGSQLQSTSNRRHAGEAVIGEEASKLEIGIDPGFGTTKEFENQVVAEDDGRVTLLCPDDARLDRTRTTAQIVECRRAK